MSYPKAPQVKVRVAAEDINKAIPKHSGHCMISDSIKRVYPQYTHVATDIQTIRFTDPTKGLRYTYLTPRMAQSALLSFDQEIKPEPFEFSLKGGHVSKAGQTLAERAYRRAKKKISPKQAEAARRNLQKIASLKRKILVKGPNPRSVPTIVGGKPPPIAPGTRREFGLRAFGNLAAMATQKDK